MGRREGEQREGGKQKHGSSRSWGSGVVGVCRGSGRYVLMSSEPMEVAQRQDWGTWGSGGVWS